jgi:hypothetical protein
VSVGTLFFTDSNFSLLKNSRFTYFATIQNCRISLKEIEGEQQLKIKDKKRRIKKQMQEEEGERGREGGREGGI